VYTPRHFCESDLVELDRLVERDPFVTLITNDADGSPFASHLPVLYNRDDNRILVEGHWARPNPQAQHAGAAMMIVHGPHAYVSPSWYLDKESAARVPTWNYAIAHLGGNLVTSTETGVLADLVARLSRRFEMQVGSDWEFDAQRDEHVAMLRGIIAFRFEPTQIELKFKLNQNHPPQNVSAASEALQRQGQPMSSEIAALMRRRLPSA
jgi:transcriptional regulator